MARHRHSDTVAPAVSGRSRSPPRCSPEPRWRAGTTSRIGGSAALYLLLNSPAGVVITLGRCAYGMPAKRPRPDLCAVVLRMLRIGRIDHVTRNMADAPSKLRQLAA